MIDIEQVRSAYDLREVAAQDLQLRRESAQELSGACPKCDGDDRFHVNAERFMCRNCHPQWGDVVEYVSWMHKLEFLAAVEYLDAGAYPTSAFSERCLIKPIESEAWLAGAQQFVNRTIELIHHAPMGEAASYLLSRGIYPRTWETFNLGFAPRVYVPSSNSAETAQAISIPWFRQRQLIGIRFRFLEQQNGYTKTAYAGSNFSGTLYGGHALKGRDKLVLCEGELNAVSLWQETDNFDVLSIGSESTAVTRSMQKHLARWQSIYIWVDKNERGKYIASHFPNAYFIQSEHDANELLQEGMLQEFIDEQTEKKCRLT